MPAQRSWVESAVREMRRSNEYRMRVTDEWYEALPVAEWNASGIRIVVRFGRHSLEADRGADVRVPCLPHLQCMISYPALAMEWQEISPAGVVTRSFSGASQGNVMTLRRTYYEALSQMLEFWLVTSQQVRTSEKCKFVAATQRALLDAAEPSLSWYYMGATRHIKAWLDANCENEAPR